MINATLTRTFGTQTPVVDVWTDLSKKEIVRLEKALTHSLLQMNELADDVLQGGSKPAVDKVKGDLSIEFVLMEGEEVWHRTTLFYPNTGDGTVAIFEGLVQGQLSKLPDTIKGKKPKKHGK
jgi:hypothetical protein